jgi:hypothetical protein
MGDIDNKDIPYEFVWKNLTEYQKETIKLKYKIFNLYYKYLNEERMKVIDASILISENVNKDIETVFKIRQQIKKAMK